LITAADITIVMPTYGREKVLLESLTMLFHQGLRAHEIILVDQTFEHELETMQALDEWVEQGEIKRVTFSPPSIPKAMNIGLLEAQTDYVLYLDDDIIPVDSLISAYLDVLNEKPQAPSCINGQVIQPNEEEIDFDSWKHSWFPFNSDRRQYIEDVIACNLCVGRKDAIAVGGFDENFKGSAYKFESEFARRIVQSGRKIQFEPLASIRHLRASSGGTRVKASQLTTWRPHHAVGKYYYAFQGGFQEAIKAVLIQPLRAIRTKHHLHRPWWIPASLMAEFLGIGWAFILWVKGPQLLSNPVKKTS